MHNNVNIVLRVIWVIHSCARQSDISNVVTVLLTISPSFSAREQCDIICVMLFCNSLSSSPVVTFNTVQVWWHFWMKALYEIKIALWLCFLGFTDKKRLIVCQSRTTRSEKCMCECVGGESPLDFPLGRKKSNLLTYLLPLAYLSKRTFLIHSKAKWETGLAVNSWKRW